MNSSKKACVIKKIFCMSMLITSNLFSYYWVDKEHDLWFAFSGRFNPEMFYGENINLLNNDNHADRVLFFRHTLDLSFDASWGKEKCGDNIIVSRFQLRDRGIWGNPRSISSTTFEELRVDQARLGAHRHFLPRHYFWIREAWMEFDVNNVFNLCTLPRHTFTIGAFRFELGRGIALGDAYAVGPELLGFYTDSVVDQYAFGAKLTGYLIEDTLWYDLYSAILQNDSAFIGDTAARIRGQQYGCRFSPERGFGKINYLFAGRLDWNAVKYENFKLFLEPYWLFNDQPEQKIEFLGDASAILGTIGMAGELTTGQFEFGFDTALNLGRQKVYGWDKNIIEITNYDGNLKEVNSKVKYNNPNDKDDPLNGKKFPYVPNGPAQTIIENSPQSETDNGKIIGTTEFNGKQVNLVNADDRFRDPYKNRFDGWMFVTDAGWWNKCHDLMLAITFGIASGDNNPNEETKDGVYSGFIPLQSIYSGKRVKSAFILGGSGKLSRPLSFPISQRASGRFARSVNGFTNLVFTGGSIFWKPTSMDGKLNFMPNMIFYWQDFPSRAFDVDSGLELNRNASKFLGTEFSLFVDYYLQPPLRFYLVFTAFIPGTHFTDILGKPITAEGARAIQERIRQIEAPDRTGFLRERIPNIGDNTAIAFNIGVDYKF